MAVRGGRYVIKWILSWFQMPGILLAGQGIVRGQVG